MNKLQVPKDTMSEHAHQVALFAWAWLARKQRPLLDMLVAIPNGGQRHKAVAAKIKAEGAKSGFPDIQLNVPVGPYAGLFIEMKTATGRVSDKQKEWIERLNGAGNRAVVCRGWLQAQTEIIKYLDGRTDE